MEQWGRKFGVTCVTPWVLDLTRDALIARFEKWRRWLVHVLYLFVLGSTYMRWCLIERNQKIVHRLLNWNHEGCNEVTI